MHTEPTSRWSLVVVPLKPLHLAKSRLGPGVGGVLRPRFALAFAQDTVRAALASPAVLDVTVVTDDPAAGAQPAALGAHIVPDVPADGLNAALAYGAHTARQARPDAPVAALNADLPALRGRPRRAAGVCCSTTTHPWSSTPRPSTPVA
ncbi:hypothetical protein [Nonomuraea terrae]|uniref:hypothetical protein n=1 Tax=Nonomuraea terrae TaxID=2530383 RepID=UPI001CB6D4D1|nr:hypothetical protein [Nonomuraea terrae]